MTDFQNSINYQSERQKGTQNQGSDLKPNSLYEMWEQSLNDERDHMMNRDD